MTVSAILLAAGRARRMGRQENKVFLSIGGTPVLAWAAMALASSPRVVELIVVADAEELGIAAALLPPLGIPVRIVEGGEERQDSALAGVTAAAGDLVLLHDAARPFPPQALIERVIDGTLRHGACIPVVPVIDTLRHVEDNGFATPNLVDRTGLVRVQTPQGFRTELVRRALSEWRSHAPMTDDAAAVLALGVPVATVPGDIWNLKLTTPEDLGLAEAAAERVERR
ncbi:MAG: 2-C-methyl-D-erythritol 4-phosphate cytidylyltransferase [Candidatus Bipolaricaulota bacterium]|nr:2-C-methyl-D-erythritol 4-phosphate cytidylyltransferase [Candidatus Bipolaricaulota bacterium]